MTSGHGLNIHYLQDPLGPRLRRLPHGQLTGIPDLYSDDERKTSPAYNEGMRRLGSRNGLIVRFDGPGGVIRAC